MQFDTLDDIRAFCRDLPPGDARSADAAARRQQNLTKPPGSLGRLEELAVWLARWQGSELPRLEHVTIAVFAGNHGVAARGVSAYPPAVTAQMVANFAAGGAAINQLAGLAGAELRVVPIELDRPTRDFHECRSRDGCADEFLDAVNIGYRTVPEDCDLLAVGEMGIANTTTAAMLCAALLGGGAARWAGRGTGVDDEGLARKRAAIEAALRASIARYSRHDPLGSGGRTLGRPRACRDRRRGPRGAAPPDPRCCSTALSRPRRSLPLARGESGIRWIIAAPVTSPPDPRHRALLQPNSASPRCSTSTCGWAKPPAPASPSCCCARLLRLSRAEDGDLRRGRQCRAQSRIPA